MLPYSILMLEFLPNRIRQAVSYCNQDELYELRIRSNKPIAVNLKGVYCFLGAYGRAPLGQALIATKKEVEEITLSACEYSLYTATEQMKQSFLTTKSGERIGIAGRGICDNGQVLNIVDIESVCVRIPHEVKGCASGLVPYCIRPKLCNTLLLSPPGMGKTTTLRDIIRIVSDEHHKNIAIVDERGELSALYTGIMSDIILSLQKKTAIPYAIRVLRPDVLVTDELLDDEFPAVQRAMQSGVTVFASAHCDVFHSLGDLGFERYVYFGDVGKIAKIYDANGVKLYG